MPIDPTENELTELTETIFNFQKLTPQARFLFGQQIEKYMETSYNYFNELRRIHISTSANNSIVPAHSIERLSSLELYFGYEARSGCRVQFDEYLDFSNWKGRSTNIFDTFNIFKYFSKKYLIAKQTELRKMMARD